MEELNEIHDAILCAQALINERKDVMEEHAPDMIACIEDEISNLKHAWNTIIDLQMDGQAYTYDQLWGQSHDQA